MGRAGALISMATLVAASCGGSGDDAATSDATAEASVTTDAAISGAPATTGPETATGDPDSALECEQRGYPCSLADVPAEVIRRSGELATEANERLDDGASMIDVAAWLEELEDVAEVDADAGAIRYRVDGGREFWLLGEGMTGSRGSFAPPTPGHLPEPAPPPGPAHVAGPGEEIKSALVLSPVLYQFANTDDGPVVANLLEGTPDYAGNVRYAGNESATSTAVTLDDYEGWEAYDVVHVSTHGRRICAQEPCRGMIVAGPLDAVLPPGPGEQIDKIAGLDFLDRPGVGVSIGRSGNGYVILTADFFRAVYPGGLDDTFVFFNACQTLGSGQTDLAEAIIGSSSTFVGWSEVVASLDALDAAAELYGDMTEHGVTGDDAFADLDAGVTVGVAYKDHDPPVLQMLDRRDGDHLRIREIVELLGAGTDDPVELDDVPIDGIVDDGKADAVPYRVRVDGHDELQAAAAVLHVEVDGVRADPRAVDEGSGDDEGTWIVDGAVDLGRDVTEEGPVAMRAWVELPDGGESFDEETIELVGEPPMGSRWEMTATHTGQFTNLPSTPATVTATLTFVFESGQARSEPRPRYSLEGGTVHVDPNSTYGHCTFSADPFTYEVEPEDFYGIQFDTTTGVVQYTGYVLTQGPFFDRAEACGEGTTMREHRVLTSWLDLRGEWRPITDPTTASGVQEHQDGCCYVRRSEYMLRRVD